MKNAIGAWVLVLSIFPAAMAQTHSAASSPATASAPSGKVLKFPGLRVDLTAGQVVMDAEVCLRKGPLELLVCNWGTKEHESILHTKARSAHLHAALLALGLAAGIPAQWSGTDEQARFLPPRGGEVKIILRWKDADGKARQADAGDWLASADPKKPGAPANKWVFTGSEILPDGSYQADLPENGHVISVSNFPDAVLDVPFESTSSDADLQFEAATDNIPPNETPVEVVIIPLADAAKSPYARAMVEIDALGQFKVEGKDVTPQQLSDWAGEFTQKHPKAQVVIRADGKALVGDVEQARLQLRYGGVRDFCDQPFPAGDLVLPRTARQLSDQLADWKKRFENPRDYMREPGGHSQDVIEDIQRQVKQLDALRDLWMRYADQLRKGSDEYRASTRPSGSGAVPGNANTDQ